MVKWQLSGPGIPLLRPAAPERSIFIQLIQTPRPVTVSLWPIVQAVAYQTWSSFNSTQHAYTTPRPNLFSFPKPSAAKAVYSACQMALVSCLNMMIERNLLHVTSLLVP